MLAGLVFVERALVMVGALALGRGGRAALAAGVALAAVAVAERPLRLWVRVLAVRAAGERIFQNLLAGNALRPPVVVDDPQTAIAEGWILATQVLADWLPDLAGGALACAVALAVLGTSLSAGALGVAGASAAAALVLVVVTRTLSYRAFERMWNAQQRAADLVGDALGGRLDIVGGGRVEGLLRRSVPALKDWQKSTRGAGALSLLVGRGPQLLLGAAVVVLYLAFPASGGRDVLIAAATLPAFATVAGSLYQLHRASVRLRPTAQLLSKRSPATGVQVDGAPDGLTLECVSVALGGRTVLEHVSCTARRCEVTILAGANGSGKSTLLHAMLGLVAYEGSLRLGSQEVSKLDAVPWRHHVAFLSQRPYLASRRPVAYSMTLLEPDLSADDMRRVLDKVGVLERLVRRGDAPLDVSVDTLSAGERQRVALARVLARDADVYLLDEPDANLDAAGVSFVAKVLRELAGAGKIVVVAAHTPELIEAADRVLYLEGGRVTRVEQRRAPPGSPP